MLLVFPDALEVRGRRATAALLPAVLPARRVFLSLFSASLQQEATAGKNAGKKLSWRNKKVNTVASKLLLT